MDPEAKYLFQQSSVIIFVTLLTLFILFFLLLFILELKSRTSDESYVDVLVYLTLSPSYSEPLYDL